MDKRRFQDYSGLSDDTRFFRVNQTPTGGIEAEDSRVESEARALVKALTEISEAHPSVLSRALKEIPADKLDGVKVLGKRLIAAAASRREKQNK